MISLLSASLFRTMENERSCTILINAEKGVPPSLQDIQKKIEAAGNHYILKKDGSKLVEVLEELLLFMIQGETYPRLLMHIIRFMVTSDDHRVKKLLMIYWELCDKTREDGTLKEEMILVCNAILKDLNHPNEFIRGSTLRLLCRMRYYKILEPCVQAILSNLSHRHSYVRRNAIMCVFAIVKTFGVDSVPGVVQEVEKMLLVEGDLSAKRNALVFLLHADPERVTNYVLSMQEQVQNMGDICQLVVLDLVRRVARGNPQLRSRLLRVVVSLSRASPAVAYESACVAISMSSGVASQLAIQSLVSLLNTQPDISVKLVILEKLASSKISLEENLIEICRALSCPAVTVKQKIMELVSSSLTSARFAEPVSQVLIKELRNESADRKLVVETLHYIAVRFGLVAQVATALLCLLSDASVGAEALDCLRDFVARDGLNDVLLDSMRDGIAEISDSTVLRGTLWLLGEFKSGRDLLDEILKLCRPIPIALKAEDHTAAVSAPIAPVLKTVVLADGTYSTMTTVQSHSSKREPHLRRLLASGDSLLMVVVAQLVAKCVLRTSGISGKFKNEGIFLIANLARLAKDESSVAAISFVLKALAQGSDAFVTTGPRERLLKVVGSPISEASNVTKRKSPVDALPVFRQLRGKESKDVFADDSDLAGPAGDAFAVAEDTGKHFSERVAKSVPLTGLADPVYIEGFMHLRGLDLAVELWVYNRTPETLQNVSVDLCCTGEMKQVEKPGTVTLAAGESAVVSGLFKVTSTEASKVFGYVSFDRKDRATLVLNEMTTDVLEYMEIASVSEHVFRERWVEFEWENKIAVDWLASGSSAPVAFLERVLLNTNMGLVGWSKVGKKMKPEIASDMANGAGAAGSFVSANIAGRSIFGEEALANISVESMGDKVTGTVRIRARSQGIALSIGERVNTALKVK